MNKFIQTIKEIWQIEELKNKILLTLGFMAVYRFASQITLPALDVKVIAANLANTNTTGGGLQDILNIFTGGGFSSASVMALGIMPYISASIVVQLMEIAIPYLQKLRKEGESGNKKITQITRWLTIVITVVQGTAYATNLESVGIPASAFLAKNTYFYISSVLILTSGTIFAMWLGEKITDKGIGNGISLLIMIGIIARLPQSFAQEFSSKISGTSSGGAIMILLEVAIWFVLILASVYLVSAVRRVAVQYARKSATGSVENVEGSRDYIPLKVNAAGVMPIIFAQALMVVPSFFVGLSQEGANPIVQSFTDPFGFGYNLTFAILIIIFSFFYTAVTVRTDKMADDLKRSGGFIPGIRPGKETADMIDSILSRITFPGSLFLAFLAVIPAFAFQFGITPGWAMFYGGTSLLIMVGVAVDTIQQINAYLLNRHYDGLMKQGNKRKSIA